MPNRAAFPWCRAAAPKRPEPCAGRCVNIFAELETDYPYLKENMLSAMGNLDTGRLLDPRYLDLDGAQPEPAAPLLPIVTEP